MVILTGPDQTVKPGAGIIFTESTVYGRSNIIHRDGSSVITLPARGCPCRTNAYELSFGANVGFPATAPTGETAATAPITLAFDVSGQPDLSTLMSTVPAAADDLMSVSRTTAIGTIGGCCASSGITNTSNGTITVSAPVLVIKEEGESL